MSYFDDLKTRLDQGLQQAGQTFQTYLAGQVVDAGVKIGQAATGNLSEAQIRAGMLAQSPPLAPPQSMPVVRQGMNIVSLCAIGAIAYLLFSKKAGKK